MDERKKKKREERRRQREKEKAAQRATSDLVPEKTETKEKKKRKGLLDATKKGSGGPKRLDLFCPLSVVFVVVFAHFHLRLFMLCIS